MKRIVPMIAPSAADATLCGTLVDATVVCLGADPIGLYVAATLARHGANRVVAMDDPLARVEEADARTGSVASSLSPMA